MTPVNIRNVLSQALLSAVTRAALEKLPSLVSVPSQEALDALVQNNPLVYKAENTFGLIVDRVYAELPGTEDLSPSVIHAAFEACRTQEDSPIASTVDAMAQGMARVMSSSYGLLQDLVLPETESVMSDVHQLLLRYSAFRPVEAAQEAKFEGFGWDLLGDPIVVGEAITVAREQANAMLPDQPLRPAHFDGVFAAASRHVPKNLGTADRALIQEQITACTEGAPQGRINSYISAFCTPNGFHQSANTIKDQLRYNVSVKDGLRSITDLYHIAETVMAAAKKEDSAFTTTAVENAQHLLDASLLFAAGAQIARETYYKDALILSVGTENGKVSDILLNNDLLNLANTNNISIEDCAVVADDMHHEKLAVSNRGISLSYVAGHKDAHRASRDKRIAALEQHQAFDDRSDFTQAFSEVLSKHSMEYLQTVGVKRHPAEVRNHIQRIAFEAAQPNHDVFDGVARYLVDLTQNPQLSLLASALEKAQTADDARTVALTDMALSLATAPVYLEQF